MKRTSTLINEIYSKINESKITSHIYSDETWQGVDDIANIVSSYCKAISFLDNRNLCSWLSVEGTGYKTNKEGQTWKEYIVHIEDNDNEIITGTIVCSGAGTVDYPLSKYDVCITLWQV